MNNKQIQMVMTAAGFYRGGIDGVIGPKTLTAIGTIELVFHAKYTFKFGSANNKRRLIAATQACLTKLNFEPGIVDGREGNNTREAMNAFLFSSINRKAEIISRTPLNNNFSDDIPRQRDLQTYYGIPKTTSITNSLITLRLPFKFRIDYNLKQSTNKITVHKKASDSLERGLIAVHKYYGEDYWRNLGLDRYAGAYNPRRMRGGSKWSTHAYGCAIDFFARPNGLRMKCPQALFCAPEYKPFLDIMQEHEWLPALRLWGADAMHFQRATL